ncbi:hypothetical protein DWX64_07015 [Clostridium sp. AF20-17LB]|nr:hypothetical protein DWX64_07015 [Clostridium sp. AF20-17LB]
MPKMRTRAKMKVVAGDRARRENVPRHIPFCLADELNIITMQKRLLSQYLKNLCKMRKFFQNLYFYLKQKNSYAKIDKNKVF